MTPKTAEAKVLVSQPAMLPKVPPMAWWTSCSRWWTKSYGACQPRSSRPTSSMWPPTQSIAAIPMTEIVASSLGVPTRRPWPILPPNPDERWVRRRPMSSSFTMIATTPYTAIVMAMATTTRITSRLRNGSLATSLSAITMISAERMRSVRIAPATIAFSASSPPSPTGTADPAPHLLEALVAEVGTADHQDRGEQTREELAEQQRHRQDDDQLVAQRADRDPLDHRELAVGGHSVDVLRSDGGVVDHDSGGLRGGPARSSADVVDRRGG